MSVFERIQKEIHEGLILYTPVQRREFVVKRVEVDRLVFFVGKTNIEVSKDCWNGIPNFLKDKDWVTIGALHETLDKIPSGTLERYLRENSTNDKSKESQGCYVVSLLEHLKIVEVYHGRPSQIRLK
jgi:hypothetical protein